MSETAHTTARAAPIPDESELLRLLRANQPQACEQFVRSYTGVALAVARRILKNDSDAQDAVQDAFLSFFRSLDGFREGARLTTWLHRIVVNAALMRRRSLGSRREVIVDDLLPKFDAAGHRLGVRPGGDSRPDEALGRDELRARVQEKIAQLPQEYRDVLVHRDIQGLDTAETAALLGDSPGAIKTRLHRARQALRALLEGEIE